MLIARKCAAYLRFAVRVTAMNSDCEFCNNGNNYTVITHASAPGLMRGDVWLGKGERGWNKKEYTTHLGNELDLIITESY